MPTCSPRNSTTSKSGFSWKGSAISSRRSPRARRLAVRLHRLLATQRSLIHRFERDSVQSDDAPLQVETSKLAQRLDWLDQEMIGLRDRAHLLQEEVSLRMADQTNRNLQVLAIVTTVFLPATLITESSA
jgi:zinc transporter